MKKDSRQGPGPNPSTNETLEDFYLRLTTSYSSLTCPHARGLYTKLTVPEEDAEVRGLREALDHARNFLPKGDPREVLIMLTQLIRQRSIEDLGNKKALAGLDFAHQVLVLGREITQDPLRRAAEAVWKDMFSTLSQGYIPLFIIPSDHCYPFAESCEMVNWQGLQCRKIPLDHRFNTLVGASNIFQTFAAFEMLFTRFTNTYLKVLRSIDNATYSVLKGTDQVLALRKAHAIDQFHTGEDALGAGFGAGMQLTVRSVMALLEAMRRDGLWETFTGPDMKRMVDHHRSFISPMSTWSFVSFARFLQIVEHEKKNGVHKYLQELTNDPLDEGIPVNPYLEPHCIFFNPKYFRSVVSFDRDNNMTITLDLDISQMSDEHLVNLIAVSKAFGCPAKSVIAEMVPWALDTLYTIGLSRLTSAKNT